MMDTKNTKVGSFKVCYKEENGIKKYCKYGGSCINCKLFSGDTSKENKFTI